MKSGHVVYVNSDPKNVVGLFFEQAFPAGKTSAQAAQAFQGTLVDAGGNLVASELRPIELDDYQLLTSTDVNV